MATLGVILCVASILFCSRLMRKLFAKPEPAVDQQPRLIPNDSFGKFTPALSGLIPHTQKKREAIQKELLGAGSYHSNALDNFLATRNVFLFLTILVGAAIFALELFPGHQRVVLIVTACACVFIYGLPRIWLSSRATARTREIEYALPDAMDMIAMSIDGGLPLEQSISRVSDELTTTYPGLARELGIIARQTKSGSLGQAMHSFSQRVNLPDVVAWSTLMQQNQQLGGRIVDSMLDYADRIRATRKHRAEHAGNTVSAKLLLPVVLCLSPPIFILLVGPAVLDFRDFIYRERDETIELVEQARAIPLENLSEGNPQRTIER